MITKENWRTYLIMDDKGNGLKKTSQQNTLLVMRFDRKTFGTFRAEDGLITVEGGAWNHAPEKRGLTDGDLTSIAGHLEYCGLRASRTAVKRSIDAIVELGDQQ